MVRITPDLILQAEQSVNPCKDRELNLRGYRIPEIENMGVTRNQFHTIDFSDNEIRKLSGFPVLDKLYTLIFNNNRIVSIADNNDDPIGNYLPNLEMLILTGNCIQDLSWLNHLASLKNLRILSLLHCPVTKQQYYRFYVIHSIPQLKVLDFRKIKSKERKEAAAFFKTKEGKKLKKGTLTNHEIKKNVSEPARNASSNQRSKDVEKIRQAITQATSLAEIDRLQQMLQSGKIYEEISKIEQQSKMVNGQQKQKVDNNGQIEEEESEEEQEEKEDNEEVQHRDTESVMETGEVEQQGHNLEENRTQNIEQEIDNEMAIEDEDQEQVLYVDQSREMYEDEGLGCLEDNPDCKYYDELHGGAYEDQEQRVFEEQRQHVYDDHEQQMYGDQEEQQSYDEQEQQMYVEQGQQMYEEVVEEEEEEEESNVYDAQIQEIYQDDSEQDEEEEEQNDNSEEEIIHNNRDARAPQNYDEDSTDND